MEKAGHLRPSAGLGLAVLLGFVITAGPASGASAGADGSSSTIAAQRAGWGFDGDPEISDFVALAVILGLAALRRYLRA
jgi:hypothetical protein